MLFEKVLIVIFCGSTPGQVSGANAATESFHRGTITLHVEQEVRHDGREVRENHLRLQDAGSGEPTSCEVSTDG